MRAFRLAVLCSLLVLAACAETTMSPTAPTSTAWTIVNDLRWDFIAPGCAPALPLPVVAGEPETRLETKPATVVTASWLVFQDGSYRRYIVGTFARLDKVYAICSWATVDRRVDS
jgi:hypothetical protein